MRQTSTDSSETRSRAILILGPGRSGTSTLTRALAALGIYLGTHFHRPVRKNPRGNQEEVHLLKLSKAVRNSVGLRADSVRTVEPSAFRNPRTQILADRMRKAIDQYFGEHPLWAFKYAGNGRILPFWIDLLSDSKIDGAFVFAYRNPLSVASSRAKLDKMRGKTEHSQLEWLANVVPVFNQLQGHRVVVVDYDRLLDDADRELRRITVQLDIPLTARVESGIEEFSRSFLRADWRHTRFTDSDLENDDTLNPLLRRAALLLSRLASDRAAIDDEAIWTEWRDIHRLHRELAPTLRLIDELNTDVRRARWWDLARPLRLAWNKMPLLRKR
ncbi:MAG: sulfotransferase [Gammaproteobacteria bacterium]|nr:sulfotransferase [Gammaproteobacteria bacterium]